MRRESTIIRRGMGFIAELGIAAGAAAAAGAIGAAEAAAAGTALQHALNEFTQRGLSSREQQRVGGTLVLAEAHVTRQRKLGRELRSDDFFGDAGEQGRTTADEVTEGALRAAQQEWEERKIPYIAHVLGEVCFREDVSAAAANMVLEIVRSLRYRGMCFLAVGVRGRDDPMGPWRMLGPDDAELDSEAATAIFELRDLENRLLVQVSNLVATGVPMSMMLTPLGMLCGELAGLGKMSDEEALQGIAPLSNRARRDPVFAQTRDGQANP
jgi:hypothetical protein